MKNAVITQKRLSLDKNGELELNLVLSTKNTQFLMRSSNPVQLEKLLKVTMRGDYEGVEGSVVSFEIDESGDEIHKIINPLDESVFIRVEVVDIK